MDGVKSQEQHTGRWNMSVDISIFELINTCGGGGVV